MYRSTLCRIGLLSCVVAGLLVATAQAREWTSKDGKKVEAEYVGAENGFVKLRSARDGNTYTIPIETLSEVDQLLIGDDPFSRKLRENPGNPDYYVERAMARINRGRHPDALRDLNYAIKLNPKHAEAYDGRGLVYTSMEQPLKAHTEYEKAIELDPELAIAYRHRGDNYKKLANTPEGKIMVDKKVEKYRQSYQAARREQFRSKGWQPLNSTSGNVTRYGAVSMLAKADYELAEKIELGYRAGIGGWGGVGGGGGGYGVGVGTGPGYPGVVVAGNAPPLAVYPVEIVQGGTITLVANPSELAKGMPQSLGANGRPIRSAYGKSAKAKMRVNQVDFYRDVDGDGNLDTTLDQRLGTDADSRDGFSLEVSTAAIPPGPQKFFAAPEGDEASGLEISDISNMADALEKAAAKAKEIAEQAGSAGQGSGLSAEQAEGLTGQNQESVCDVCKECQDQLKTALPDIANMVADAGKPARAVGNLMKAAARAPGEESKDKASSASDKSGEAADQLAAAAKKLREMAESGEMPKAQGTAVAAAGKILPKPGPVAKAPGPGPGPGYGGDDDDDVVVVRDDDDDIHIDDDDDDIIVIDDDDDDRDLIVIDDDDDVDRVIDDYDRLLVDEPDNVVVRRDRADTYLNLGSYDYAVRDYGYLLEQDSITLDQKIDFYYNRGCAHLAAARLDNAIADFTASIELRETGQLAYMAYNNRGIAYAKQGQFDKALANFNAAIDIEPDDALAYKNRALAYKRLGKTVEADQDMARYNELSSL